MARRLQELQLFEFFLYIIAGWITIGLWQRFVENFFYNGIGLERELPYHNFIVMFIMTAIFLVVVGFVSSFMEASDKSSTSEIDQFNPGLTGKSVRQLNVQSYQRNSDLYHSRRSPNVQGAYPETAMDQIRLQRVNGSSRHNYQRNTLLLAGSPESKNIPNNRFHRVDSLLSGSSERDGGNASLRSYKRRNNNKSI